MLRKVVPVYAMKAYGRGEVYYTHRHKGPVKRSKCIETEKCSHLFYTHSLIQLHTFFSSALDGDGQLYAPAVLAPEKEPLVPNEYEARWAPEPFWIYRVQGKSHQ
jgi:hypothetical protein